MEARAFIVAIGSRQPDTLRQFYEHTVGLVPRYEFAPGAFAVSATADPCLIVEEHSEVAGAAMEPKRLLLNFVVADAAAEERRLNSAGVEIVQPTYEEPGVGFFATFADLDGNFCQLVQLSG
jgi:predicted enzyme related to lactoylglutathione lyase